MTSKNARAMGYEFTGYWTNREWEKEENIILPAIEIRKKYKCKVYVCTDKGGWGLYAEPRYRELQELERGEHIVSNQIPKELDLALQEYEAKVAKIKEREASWLTYINKIKVKYNLA